MDDLSKLQGIWNIASLEIEGAKQPDGMLTGAQIVIEKDRFTSQGMGSTYKGRFILDHAGNPKTIDMIFDEGPEKNNRSLGIYRIDGDNWQLCLTTTGKDRPKAFSTSPGSGHALETLTRASKTQTSVEPAKSQNNSSFSDLEFPVLSELQGEWKMISGIRDGYALDKMMVGSGRRVVSGCETTVSFGGKLFAKAKFKVDTSTEPFQIDYYNVAGMNAGQIQLGILEIDKGTIKLVYGTAGGGRPKEFDSKPGDGSTFTVWKKI